jgi:hypothetical protein
MANSFKIEFNINIPHAELFERLSKTEKIGKLRQDLCQNDKTRLLFKNPCKWYSSGQNVLIKLSLIQVVFRCIKSLILVKTIVIVNG